MSEPPPPPTTLPDPKRAVERLREGFTPLLTQLTPEIEPITTYDPSANSSQLPAHGGSTA